MKEAGERCQVLLQGSFEFFPVKHGGGVVGDEDDVSVLLEQVSPHLSQLESGTEDGPDGGHNLGIVRLRPGMLEREAAWLLERALRESGAEAVAFEIIVAGGPNGALPHAHAGDDPLPSGQPIVIDMGARVDGYCSDMTRTICLGQPADPNTFWTVYRTVHTAQQAALAMLRAGVTGVDADAAAREVITRAGYGEAFGHSLGHGVGLAIHEGPRLSRRSSDHLTPGMVVTVEPGVYLPGWGGVRIEDLVVVGEEGVEVLSQAPKEPIIQGDW